MAIQPTIAGYTGSLTGAPVVINPQTDRGFVSEWIVAIPSGAGTMTVTIGADVIPVPVGIILTIPGPAAQFTLNGTGISYIVYAGTGVAPTYTNVSTGATGGGAPAIPPYLLDGATVDSLLPNGVAVGALDHTVDFVRVVGSSAGASTPVKLVGSSAANPLQVGGGVALPLRQITTSGEQTIAQLGAFWVDVSNPADPKGALVLALGASDTLAMIIKLGEIDLPGAWTIKSSGQLALQSGAASLDVGGTRVSNMADGVAPDDAATIAQARSMLLFGGYVLGVIGGGTVKLPYGFGNYSVQPGGDQIVCAGKLKRMIVEVDANSATAGAFSIGVAVNGAPHYITNVAAGVTGLQPIAVADVALADGDTMFVYVMSSVPVDSATFQCRVALDYISA